jgi:hypothetical protein
VTLSTTAPGIGDFGSQLASVPDRPDVGRPLVGRAKPCIKGWVPFQGDLGRHWFSDLSTVQIELFYARAD